MTRRPRWAFLRRLRLAVRFRVWPWQVPSCAVQHINPVQTVTEDDRRRAEVLARQYGWERDDGA